MEIKSNKTKTKIALSARLVTKICAPNMKRMQIFPFHISYLFSNTAEKQMLGSHPFLSTIKKKKSMPAYYVQNHIPIVQTSN